MTPSDTTVPTDRFDESSAWDASLRAAVLDTDRLAGWQAQLDRLLVAEGAGHLVHDLPVRADGRAAGLESRPWRLDPIPVVLDAATFQWLSAAVVERMEALEALLADLYGERRVVRDGVVPADVLHASERYRLGAVGGPVPSRWLSTYAVDLVRDAGGAWHVVQDFTDAPPGVGYALLDRSVVSRAAADVLARGGIASLARFPALVRRALAARSPLPSPRTVLFTGGIDHPSYIDHSYLAVQLGVHLVEGADLVVRQRRVWLRTLDGLEPVDVVYRRLEDTGIDPLEVGASGNVGVPGLLLAARDGGVSIANAHGAGVVEDRDLVPWWPAAVRHLTGERLRLPDLADGAAPLAVTPTFADGRLGSATVVLRMFAVHDGASAAVLPGGTGRVLAPGDHPSLPTACTAKDVWVVGTTLAPPVVAALPQVDFARSVPTRAADALFWTNRAAERAEAMVRTVRVISSRIEEDPGLVGLDGGRWCARMVRVAAGVRRAAFEPATRRDSVVDLDDLRGELAVTTAAITAEIGSLLTEATTVREYLSVSTGRVLERMARQRAALQQDGGGVEALDALLTDFAAFAGLWNESTVRGPAWRLGDAGRRLERALVVLDMVEAGFDAPDEDAADPAVEAAAIEVLLAADESLVAYRRRHRSDVEPDAALALLVRDATNPRSLAACLQRLEQHASDADWPAGVDLARAAQDALGLPLGELAPTIRDLVARAGAGLVERWFAAPVNPIPVIRL